MTDTDPRSGSPLSQRLAVAGDEYLEVLWQQATAYLKTGNNPPELSAMRKLAHAYGGTSLTLSLMAVAHSVVLEMAVRLRERFCWRQS